jgi:hypothetical protein
MHAPLPVWSLLERDLSLSIAARRDEARDLRNPLLVELSALVVATLGGSMLSESVI